MLGERDWMKILNIRARPMIQQKERQGGELVHGLESWMKYLRCVR